VTGSPYWVAAVLPMKASLSYFDAVLTIETGHDFVAIHLWHFVVSLSGPEELPDAGKAFVEMAETWWGNVLKGTGVT
jgi:hypothetical protein